jgi:tetratricopeptide (TPR) repeat protein
LAAVEIARDAAAMSNDDDLHRFARQVVATTEEPKEPRVDESLLRDVAADLGMTAEALQAARDQGDTHKKRAATLRSAGNLNEAIAELEGAQALNPLDLSLRFLLADALFARALRTRDDDERAHARALCMQILEDAPAHHEAAMLMNAIRNADDASVAMTSTRRTLVLVGLMAVMVAAIVTIAMTVWWYGH